MEERKEVTEEHVERSVVVDEGVADHPQADLPEPGVDTPVAGKPDEDEVRDDPHDEEEPHGE